MVYLPPHAVVFSPVPARLKRFCNCGGGCPQGCSAPAPKGPACPANLPLIPPGMKVVQGPPVPDAPRTVGQSPTQMAANMPLLVMFGGETCRITQQMLPVVRAFMNDWQQHTGQAARVAYVNASRQPQLNAQWGVTGTPTFFVIDPVPSPACGKLLVHARLQGFITQDALTVLYTSMAGAWRGMAVPGT